MRVHYPRTAHLPWSPGATSDDVRAGDLRGLLGQEVVVTEKLDGENTTLYRDGLHARSLDSAHHPSRAWVKSLQGRISALIPVGWRVCGENLYARHSLPYADLDSWFYGFSVWDNADRCLDWDATVRFLRDLGIPTPRVLWRGTLDEKALRAIRALRLDLGRQEGYVVRTVAGFDRGEFAARVAKWVRPNHVQTDVHWMRAEIVPNGLGPQGTFWSIRSGGTVDTSALVALLYPPSEMEAPPQPANSVIDETLGAVDAAHRFGDVRLIAALAAVLHQSDRSTVAAHLAAGPLGMPLARRVADLIGLYPRVHAPFPDDRRRSGLARMSLAADLVSLHALAEAALTTCAEEGDDVRAARELTQWSALHAEDAGLMVSEPWRPLRDGLRAELASLDRDAADRCWAQARSAWSEGKLASVEEAAAATWKFRGRELPQLIQLSGPSGSGKSRFAAGLLPDVARVVSMDDLRAERGSRAAQRSNPEILTAALADLEAALRAAAPGTRVLWDATGLNRPQRNLVLRAAHAADATVTQAVFLVPGPVLSARNATRPHSVPAHVLTNQLRRYQPPYPGESHRIWYLGADATDIGDADGALYYGD